MNKIIDNPKEATKYLNTYDFTTVAFDTETRSLKYTERWCHGGSYEEGDPTGISFYNGKEAVYIDTCGWTHEQMGELVETLIYKWQEGVLKAKGKTIIAHNIVYDMGVMNKYGIKLWGAEWFDTLTASHLIDENRTRGGGGHGLKALAQDILGEEEIIPWEEAKCNKSTFQEYACNDAIWTWELAERFTKMLHHAGLTNLFRKIEMPFQRVLLQMNVTGVLIDLPRIKSIRDKAKEYLYNKEKEILDYLEISYTTEEDDEGNKLLNTELNINSNQQMIPIFTDKVNLELTETTKTGRLSLNKEALKPFSKNEFVKMYLDYKKMRHITSQFVNKIPYLVQEDGRMRPSWKNTGTVTGRMSSSRPNFQNLPRPANDPVGIRECIIAPVGKKLIAVDFSGQENRIMAEISGDTKFIKMILEGQDQHLLNANAAFKLGIPEEYLVTTHPKYEAIAKQYKEARTKGKIFSFAVPYGAEAPNIQQSFDTTLEDAESLMKAFWDNFPGIKSSIDEARALVDKQGYVSTLTGRRRRFKPNQWGRIGQDSYRQAFNFIVQGFGADIMRIAAIKTLRYSATRPEIGLKIIMLVHDELVAEVYEEYADEVVRDVEMLFSRVWPMRLVPLAAEGSVGDNYAQAK